MKKRLLVITLILSMLFTLSPAVVMADGTAGSGPAAEGEQGGGTELDIGNGFIVISNDGYKQAATLDGLQDAQVTSWPEDEENHAVTITGSYTYTAENNAGYYVTVAEKTENVSITLKNVTIDLKFQADALICRPAIALQVGAKVTLTLEGENALTGANQGNAVQVPKDAELIIDGTGSLTAKATNHTSAIGVPRGFQYCSSAPNSNNRSGGKITINGGKIEANVMANGAGIGGSHDLYTGDITINEDAVIKTSGSYYGIAPYTGKDANKEAAGSVTITGGDLTLDSIKNPKGPNPDSPIAIKTKSLNISGGVIKATDTSSMIVDNVNITGGQLLSDFGASIGSNYRTRLKVWGAGIEQVGKEVSVQIGEDTTFDAVTVPDTGILPVYLYLPATEQNFTVTPVEQAEGTVAYTAKATPSEEGDSVIYVKREGENYACVCTENNAKLSFGSDYRKEITMYKDTQSVTEGFPKAVFTPDENCYYPGEHEIAYALSVKEGSQAVENAGDYVTDNNDGTLTFNQKNTDYRVTVTASLKKAGSAEETDSVSADFVISVVNKSDVYGFDVSQGKVTVTAAEEAGKVTYQQGEGGEPITVSADTEVVFYGTTAAVSDGLIVITDCSPTIRIDNLEVKPVKYGGGFKNISPIQIIGDSHAVITIEGENKLIVPEDLTMNPGGLIGDRRGCGIKLTSQDEDKPAKVTVQCSEVAKGGICSGKNCPDKLYLFADAGTGIGSDALQNDYFEINISGGHILPDNQLEDGTGRYGAGIGSGWTGDTITTSCIINVSGGYIEGKKSGGAPVLGLGQNAGALPNDDSLEINISGGTVEARYAQGSKDTPLHSVAVGIQPKDGAITAEGPFTVNISGTGQLIIDGNIAASKVNVTGNGTLTVNETADGTKGGNLIGNLSTSGSGAVNIENNVFSSFDGIGGTYFGDTKKEGGNVTVSDDSQVTIGGTIDKEFTFETEDGKTVTVTPKENGNLSLDKDGTVIITGGAVIETQKPDGSKETVTVTDEGMVKPDGAVVDNSSGGGGYIPPSYTDKAVANVIQLIDKIGEVTADSEAAVTAAREAYDKLTAYQQTKVTNRDKLTAAEKTLAELKEAARTERIKNGVKNTTLKARSKIVTRANGKKAIKVYWTKSWGYKVDRYEVFRSTKRNSGYGTKAFYTTKTGTQRTYVNTKALKKGTKYYYKVRGVREIGGETVYTKWSLKAIRVAK